MPISVNKIEALAPDQASLAAAVKIKPASWPLLAIDAASAFAWGECQGSGSTPYRVCVHVPDLGYKCSCPSRKFPCKHSLALMLLLAKSTQSFSKGDVPDWVREWSNRRRPAGEKKSDEPKPANASLDAAMTEPTTQERDEKAEARAAQQRERLKAQREEAILVGLDELDLWISDNLNRGLSGFMASATQACRSLAQRMVDAKAQGLASWIDALPGKILSLPEHMRGDALIENLGDLHLLAQAYRRQAELPEALRHDVRRLVGWTMERQALLEMPDVKRIEAVWTVTGTHVEVQPDRLKRIETWLLALHDGKASNAVLIDFIPVATSAGGSVFLPGETLAAELVFYPSATPLRAIISRRLDGTELKHALPVGESLSDVLDGFERLRAVQPWLNQWPLTVKNVRCRSFGKDGLWIGDDAQHIPVQPLSQDDARALCGVTINTLTGLWDGRFFAPMLAQTSLGQWVRQ